MVRWACTNNEESKRIAVANFLMCSCLKQYKQSALYKKESPFSFLLPKILWNAGCMAGIVTNSDTRSS